MKKKIVAMLVMALSAVTILSGCGSSDDGSNNTDNTKEESSTSTGGKTKIRFASWDNADDLDNQQKLVDRFNESQDKIEVTLEAYGSDYDTKISAGMGSKDTPDVLYMWNYPAYYAGLEPLDSYMENEGAEFKDNFYDALWDYNKIGDEIYGLPVGFTTHALYYNKDIFEEAGVAEPTNDWTWDDLQNAAKQINEKNSDIKGFSFQSKADPYDFEMYLWSNGAAFVDEEGSLEGNLNSDKSVEVFEMFQNMEKDGYAVATEKNGSDEFRSGKTAMYIYGSWAISNLDSDGLNYGIVDIPAFKDAGKDSVSILSSSGISIAKDSKNKEAAWEFIKYWTGEEMNKERIGYELPALKSVVESEKILDNPKNAPFYSMLEQSSGYTPTSFIVDNWSELFENLELTLERIFNPSTLEDPKTVLDEVAGM